jgi:hypothetical protein
MGDKRREVPAECLFADTVADIAVLGEPDNQKFLDEAAAYDALVGHVKPYRLDEIFLRAELYKLPSKETIFDLPKGECGGWLLALDGHWFRCDLGCHQRSRCVSTSRLSSTVKASVEGQASRIDISSPPLNGSVIVRKCCAGSLIKAK